MSGPSLFLQLGKKINNKGLLSVLQRGGTVHCSVDLQNLMCDVKNCSDTNSCDILANSCHSNMSVYFCFGLLCMSVYFCCSCVVLKRLNILSSFYRLVAASFSDIKCDAVYPY